MTQEQIEGTKVIAEFDGWEKRLSEKGQHSKTPLWYKVHSGYAAFDLSAMKYHSSWDWLMPAVNKFINQNTRPSEGQDMYAYRQYCNRLYNEITNFQLYSVFYLLVEAIQWDNKNNKK
jgi:hypothetical protein